MYGPFGPAIDDLKSGVRMNEVWRTLAKEDITDQHRRTTLGPFWMLLNYLLLVGTFIVIFGPRTTIENFPTYVSSAFLVWTFVSEAMTQSVSLFTRNKPFIEGTVLPLSIYIFRMTAQSIARMAYAMIGFAVILFFTDTEISIGWIYSAVALIVIVATLPAIIIVFAFIGAFFRDMQFIMSNAIRVGMFVTPIFWATDKAFGIRHAVYTWNPFTYVVEMFRTPLMTGIPDFNALGICVALSIFMWISALFLLGAYRDRIVFLL